MMLRIGRENGHAVEVTSLGEVLIFVPTQGKFRVNDPTKRLLQASFRCAGTMDVKHAVFELSVPEASQIKYYRRVAFAITKGLSKQGYPANIPGRDYPTNLVMQEEITVDDAVKMIMGTCRLRQRQDVSKLETSQIEDLIKADVCEAISCAQSRSAFPSEPSGDTWLYTELDTVRRQWEEDVQAQSEDICCRVDEALAAHLVPALDACRERITKSTCEALTLLIGQKFVGITETGDFVTVNKMHDPPRYDVHINLLNPTMVTTPRNFETQEEAVKYAVETFFS